MLDNKGCNNGLQTQSSQILMYNAQEDYQHIHFLQFITALYKKSWLIVLMTVVGILLATALTFVLKPKYKVTSFLNESSLNQYAKVESNTGIKSNPFELFSIFLNTLSDPQNYNQFLKEDIANNFGKYIKPLSAKKTKFNTFNLKHSVAVINNKDVLALTLNQKFNKIRISNNGVSAELTILSSEVKPQNTINKAYLAYTNQRVLKELAEKQKAINQIKIEKLHKQINRYADVLKIKYAFNIDKIKDQINTIKSHKPSQKDKLNHLNEQLDSYEYNLSRLISSNQSDDTRMLDLELKLRHLKKLSFDLTNINIFQIDGKSVDGFSPINKKLMILLGAFFGFVLAMVYVLMDISFRVRKELTNI